MKQDGACERKLANAWLCSAVQWERRTHWLKQGARKNVEPRTSPNHCAADGANGEPATLTRAIIGQLVWLPRRTQLRKLEARREYSRSLRWPIGQKAGTILVMTRPPL